MASPLPPCLHLHKAKRNLWLRFLSSSSSRSLAEMGGEERRQRQGTRFDRKKNIHFLNKNTL